ncbi:MAG: PhzF family phenazine biosynthesis isomerase [Actinophytocola sp.]|uniref:PhzF family phenazine biosynthesis protein n=1 Tax=Actinophytocola sp. TaxID=1872138 RepID=UPI001327FB87|nr:PhzF family phenazine biosynthesis protein [Actinophytocola sp.]MPZ84867.1 PhzF family phenazine biosynthesis isomerase [Actinophytocola sp.]
MGFEFTLVDVFSDRPFGGNQLAVFPDAEGIADGTMQQLAREFNFSETTFVLPPRDLSHTCQVRIFTPNQELPFAGHPTVGTAAVLASLSKGDAAERQFVFEEGIGPVTVAVDGSTIRLHLRFPDYETTDEAPPAAAIAKALALPEDAIAESWYAGVGLKFCFVRLADRELVDRAVLDKAAWAAEIADGWSPHLYFFAGDYRDGAHLHARFFAPAVGVDEDPATGSACAALVASLAQRSPEQNGTYRLQIDQGVAMGRPSALEGTAHKENGRLTEVIVGGHATIVGNGTMTLPGKPSI